MNPREVRYVRIAKAYALGAWVVVAGTIYATYFHKDKVDGPPTDREQQAPPPPSSGHEVDSNPSTWKENWGKFVITYSK